MKIPTIAIAFSASLLAIPAAASQDYPSKPVRIIVPYQAGQGTDVATRYLAEHLSKVLGEAFIVENRGGAGGNIGTAEAARANPDGYTLLMGTNGTHVLNEYLYASTQFDPENDFEPVILVSSFPMVVLAAPSSPHDDLSALLAAAQEGDDEIDVGLPSTTARLVLELMKAQGVTGLHSIPYKGSSTAMTDLIGGQVQLSIDTVSASRPFVTSGKLKALAVTSREASALLPDVEPVSAQGIEDFQVIAWNGLYVPKGTPAAVVERLNAEIEKILEQPEVQQRLLSLGHEPEGGTPERLAEFARDEREIWEPVIAASGLRAE